jgi:putative SOS response-associated peptidase YedK
MCYRTKLNAVLKDIESTFNARFIEPESYTPMEEINGFSFMKTPVITCENQGEIEMFNWGLIPLWAKNNKIRKMTLNARIETIKEKPAYCNSVNNRCLSIVNG